MSKEWIDKFKGKVRTRPPTSTGPCTPPPHATHQPNPKPKPNLKQFDHGWDQQREMTFAKQKEMGIFPKDANLTARPKEIPAWDETPMEERAYYARFMEVGGGGALSVCFWEFTAVTGCFLVAVVGD